MVRKASMLVQSLRNSTLRPAFERIRNASLYRTHYWIEDHQYKKQIIKKFKKLLGNKVLQKIRKPFYAWKQCTQINKIQKPLKHYELYLYNHSKSTESYSLLSKYVKNPISPLQNSKNALNSKNTPYPIIHLPNPQNPLSPSFSLKMTTPGFLTPKPPRALQKSACKALFKTLTAHLLKPAFSKILSDSKDELQVSQAERCLESLVKNTQRHSLRSAFNSIRASALIQAKTDFKKVEEVRKDFCQFVDQMEGSIVLRILEGRTVLEKERCKRTVLKEWKRCLGVRKKQTEVEEKRRLREFRRVLEALRLRKKLKIEFKNFTEKRELNLKEEILNEFKKVRKESKFLKYVFLKNSTKMDRFKQSIAFETWRNSTLATKRQQNNLKKLACMKLAKMTPDLNSAFQTIKVTTHRLSLQPKRLLNLLRKHQRHRLLPSFSKWKQVAEFHKIEKIQSEAGPKAIALRDSRIEQASLNSLLKAETRTYALPLIRDGLKKKAFFALKTYTAKVRLLNSQFSCPNIFTVKGAFTHWKLLSKKKINTTRSHLEDRIANATHKTV